jgi:hypothetical protein
MPEMGGLDALTAIRREAPSCKVIVPTTHGGPPRQSVQAPLGTLVALAVTRRPTTTCGRIRNAGYALNAEGFTDATNEACQFNSTGANTQRHSTAGFSPIRDDAMKSRLATLIALAALAASLSGLAGRFRSTR